MVCIFCLKETNDNVSLHGSSELAKHARNVVTKHFWFNVNEINSTGKYACSFCWAEVESFFDFYGMVESNYPNILNVIDAKNDIVNPSLSAGPRLFVNETVIKDESDELDSFAADCKFDEVSDLLNFVDSKVEINEMDTLATKQNIDSNVILATNSPNELQKKSNLNTSIAQPTLQEHKKTVQEISLSTDLTSKDHLGQTIITTAKTRRVDRRTCRICQKQLSKIYLRYHMASHDPVENFILECDLCGKKFSRKSTILHHLRSHKNRETKLTAPCPICKKVLSRPNLTTHILNVHKNIRKLKYMCEVCGIGFAAPSALARHAATHVDRSLTEVQCNICGKWLKNQESLNSHKKSHKQAPQKCPHPNCDKLAYNTNEMKVHLSQFHAKHKHQCSICQKSFIRPIRLREHIASAHTGERAYKCFYCAKAFKAYSGRFRHMQDLHPREYNLDREKRTPK